MVSLVIQGFLKSVFLRNSANFSTHAVTKRKYRETNTCKTSLRNLQNIDYIEIICPPVIRNVHSFTFFAPPLVRVNINSYYFMMRYTPMNTSSMMNIANYVFQNNKVKYELRLALGSCETLQRTGIGSIKRSLKSTSPMTSSVPRHYTPPGIYLAD